MLCVSIQVANLLSVLWDSLLFLDDLSASTNSIMELMGTLLLSFSSNHLSSTLPSSPSATSHTSRYTSAELVSLVPRLWPFLGHNIASVRRSSLQALSTLLMINGGQSYSDAQPVSPVGKKEGSTTMVPHTAWLPELLQPLICQVFQRFVLEGDEENRKILHQVSRRDTLIKLFSTIKYVNSGYYFLVHNHCGYVQ